ncbi:MAG: hypothetical protein HOH66_15685 [Rhodospirillaceae bacterium]|jgi:hypothetical protein|nr:hypothetical protein [Rhodospirillaceae bacterium]MBT6119304.1 hypothetical protein [Rhodospirillaceae bacterium]
MAQSDTQDGGNAKRRALGLLVGGALAIIGFAMTAEAHHGFVRFESTQPLYFEGKIREVYWQYPHSYVRLEVAPGVALPPEYAPGETLEGRAVPEGIRAAPEGTWTLVISAFWQLEKAGIMGTDLKDNDFFQAIAYPSCDMESDVYVAFVEVSGSKRYWVTETTLPVSCE